MRYTPDNITVLEPGQVFVFGSNMLGQHHGGAARAAYLQFKAEWGVSEGMTGNCYAIPTLTEKFKRVSNHALLQSFIKFLKVVQENPNKTFLLTLVGCGIASWNIDTVGSLLYIALRMNGLRRFPRNLTIPYQFEPEKDFKRKINDIMFEMYGGKMFKCLARTESGKELWHNHVRDMQNKLDCLVDELC